ncbi:hypothetical protein [uncultured Thomasclavelia sp.]|uniref:hypothetical protein n=1 Tax=uncultured Thomasclavelia sp. TaxID=3025759 RepID=UPI002615A6C6|nr:hypothetical protein [uncultured Thomasclavelia sp.]
MTLKAKRFIVSVVSLSLLINVLSAVYIAQIKNNQEALNKSYQSQIVELEKANKKLKKDNKDNKDLQDKVTYYQDKYYDYFEYSIELEKQMGVYRNEP